MLEAQEMALKGKICKTTEKDTAEWKPCQKAKRHIAASWPCTGWSKMLGTSGTKLE